MPSILTRSKPKKQTNGAFIGTVQKRSAKGTQRRKHKSGEKIPTWADLSKEKVHQVPQWYEGENGSQKGGFKTIKFALLMFVVMVIGMLYVRHTYATQQVLEEVQALREKNTALHLEYNRLQGDLERLNSPQQVLEKAKSLGLHEGYAYGATIKVIE